MDRSAQRATQAATTVASGLAPQVSARTPETVLLVEDSKAEQLRLTMMLQSLGYRVVAAANGRQAAELLRREPIQLIVTDWQMPEISGPELCRTVRADPAFGQPYLILLTARSSRADLAAGMDAGADDFISKPCSREELRVRLQAGIRILRLRNEAEQRSLQLANALEHEAQTNRTIRRDLAVAARMQREFLPTAASPFPQLGIGTLFHPAAIVAGDGFDFLRLDDRHLAFYLIDVAGHGVASAMLSFAVSRLLSSALGALTRRGQQAAHGGGRGRNLPHRVAPPDRVVHWLNQRFVDKDDANHYFTMVYGVLDARSGAGELCQAGHPHPLIVNNARKLRRLGRGGLPVGLFAEATYQRVAFRLEPGERLVLYSDGVTDCTGENGGPLGLERLSKLLGQVHECSLEKGIGRLGERLLRQWLGNAPAEDDISLLAIERRSCVQPTVES